MLHRARIVIADDHTLVAEGVNRLLEAEFEVVAIVGDGRALVEAAKSYHPEVIVVDIGMPLLNGLDAVNELTSCGLKPKVVFLTGSADAAIAVKAIREGAAGYVLKQAASTELLTAIREALQGRTYVTPRIANEVLKMLMRGGQSEEVDLTLRERQVLQLLAEGKSAKEIAAVLEVSPRTAEFHKYNIMEKTGLRTTAELARYAARQGMLPE